MTINEFRNKHYGRGAMPPPPPFTTYEIESDRRMSKSYSFVRDGSDVTANTQMLTKVDYLT